MSSFKVGNAIGRFVLSSLGNARGQGRVVKGNCRRFREALALDFLDVSAPIEMIAAGDPINGNPESAQQALGSNFYSAPAAGYLPKSKKLHGGFFDVFHR